MMNFHNFDRLGDIVSTLGSPRFGPAFYNLFETIFALEECTVFCFADTQGPEAMLIEGRCGTRLAAARQLANDYIAGGYRLDPNLTKRSPALSIYVNEAEHIRDAAFRKHYYDEPSLAHELVILGQVDGTLYYSSFYRKREATRFNASEIRAVGAVANFMVRSLHRHRKLMQTTGFSQAIPTSAAIGERTLAHLREVLMSSHRLSPREAEICAGIVLGYSTLAISLNCSITPNTVATHRKRAYAKLGISSQNELFTRYFSTVREFQAQNAD